MYNVNEDYPKENPEWVHGIDISKFQDDENYTEDLRLAKEAGYEFCIIRATQGMVVDERLEHNFNLAMEAGMIVGFYHYWRNNVGMSGKEQGEFHQDTIYPYYVQVAGRIIPSFVDTERYYNKVGSVLKPANTRSIRECVDKIGGGNYSSQWMWHLMTTNPSWAGKKLGWVAQWTGLSLPTLYPVDWNVELTKFWQWGVAGKDLGYPTPPYVPGLKGEVDLDIFMGSLDELKVLAGKDPVPEPEPEPITKVYNGKIQMSIDGKIWAGEIQLKKVDA